MYSLFTDSRTKFHQCQSSLLIPGLGTDLDMKSRGGKNNRKDVVVIVQAIEAYCKIDVYIYVLLRQGCSIIYTRGHPKFTNGCGETALKNKHRAQRSQCRRRTRTPHGTVVDPVERVPHDLSSTDVLIGDTQKKIKTKLETKK